MLGESPRRGLEHEPVADVAVREDVFDVPGQRPDLPLPCHVDGTGRDHLVIVIHQLEQRLFDVAAPGSDQHVGPAHTLFRRQVLHDRHHHPADLAGEDVVQVLRSARASTRLAVCECPLCGVDVVRRIDHREQLEDPVPSATPFLAQGSCQ